MGQPTDTAVDAPTDPLIDDARLAERAEEWLAHGLSTAPADRPAAEAGVRAAYRAAGLAEPEHIVWLGSPAAGAAAVAMLSRGESGDPYVADWLAEQGVVPGEVTLGASVRSKVRTGPWARARSAIAGALGPVGYARHSVATTRRCWQQLTERIVSPVRTRLDADFSADGDLGEAARDALLDVIHGQYDAAWLAAFDDEQPELAGLAQVARSAGWWWAFERIAVVTERPAQLHRDNLGRLHQAGGPALSYPDGFSMYAWRGMPVPDDVAAQLPDLTAERIRTEENAEIRRVMLEYFGFDRYLSESDATRVQSDDYGILWRVDLPGDEPLVMVEVVNSTPEPDGTSRTYFLRVPPSVRTAREGVAWTFDLTADEYAPQQQT
ncbi:DUF6745 domain-containing protein [Hamadaea tsunoensis]|uniref:DUF6745 domain-containing protein n=1 Tax=Hamadaea tsunoensis TaxID=53368 RepID=UPI0003F57055|nr:hypothetical protein [Hamadaea tsunoensis]